MVPIISGEHLRIIAMEYPLSTILKRNSTNHVVEINGILKHHLIALSNMFNFSYSYLPVIANEMDDYYSNKGAISYLVNNEADYLLTTTLAMAYRYKNLDYPASWYEEPFGCIVPYPKEAVNIAASLKPFSYEVWILVAIAALMIIVCLGIVKKCQLNEEKSMLYNQTGGTGRIIALVLGNLVSQGQCYCSTSLTFRIVAGSWCAGCFFLVQIYSSTLTSHLTWPNQKPIANSIEELTNAGASLTTERGFGLDVALQNLESEKFRRLTELSKKNPKLRCNSSADCLEIVRAGNAGYGAPIDVLLLIMEQDLRGSGICRYYMMKETFFYSSVFTSLRKNSPYTENISQGILRIKQAGLYKQWISWYVATPWKCMKLNSQEDKTRRLSIGHLSSAFLILFAGYACSILALIFEKTIFCATTG